MAPTHPNERLFKYPPMERQDLNQSQLGSFKFTPIDPVNNIQSLTQSAKQYLEQQLSQRQRLAGAQPSTASSWQDNASTLSSGRPAPGAQLEPLMDDTAFFNKHIKPDLGDSRLRLGSAALRSAVDGAASPTKRTAVFTVQPDLDFNMNYHRSSNSMNASQPVSPRLHSAATFPTMDAFMTPADVASPGASDPASFSDTICVALANEQRAHNMTRAYLAQQFTRCVELEDQLKKSKQQIASMSMTIKSLGAIVKHNASKQTSEESASYNPAEYSSETEEVALRAFYREYNRLKNAAEANEDEKEQLARSQDNNLTKQHVASLPVEDAQLYNLDLLQKPDPDNSADSVLRRTLRKHFSLDSSADDKNGPITPSKKPGTLNNLIEISPESINGVSNVRLEVQNGSRDPAATQVRLLSATDSTVNSSEEVVAKYGHRTVSAALKESSNKTSLTMQHLAKLEAFCISDLDFEDLRVGDGAVQPPQENDYGRLSPVVISSDGDGQSTTAIVPSAKALPKDRVTLKIGSNLYGEPKWRVNKGNPIFEDERDKWECIGSSGPAFRNNSCFFDHPVRYLPEDAAGTVDAYRTVMVDGIPVGSTMMDVLAIVRGGPLDSVQLFPPIGKATSFMTARIIFNYEHSAHNMVLTQESGPGHDPEANRFKIRNVAVRCWMPTDPTYPRNAETEYELFGKARASRIILLHGVDEYVYNQIPYKLRAIKPGCDQHVIEYIYTENGSLSIEFSNIKTAITAFKQLRYRDPELCMIEMEYDDDYTSAPYVVDGPKNK